MLIGVCLLFLISFLGGYYLREKEIGRISSISLSGIISLLFASIYSMNLNLSISITNSVAIYLYCAYILLATFIGFPQIFRKRYIHQQKFLELNEAFKNVLEKASKENDEDLKDRLEMSAFYYSNSLDFFIEDDFGLCVLECYKSIEIFGKEKVANVLKNFTYGGINYSKLKKLRSEIAHSHKKRSIVNFREVTDVLGFTKKALHKILRNL